MIRSQSEWGEDSFPDENTLEKNLTDVDSVDLERELNIGKEEESMNSPDHIFMNQKTRIRGDAEIRGAGQDDPNNQNSVEIGIGDVYNEMMSEFENPNQNQHRNRSGDAIPVMQIAGHARNNSLMDPILNSHR